MKDVNEDDLKNKEDLHRWKAHGAGHIPLWGIFYYQLLRMVPSTVCTPVVNDSENSTILYKQKCN